MSARRPAHDLPAATGIVLAGGDSTRFGRDKLVEPVRGRPLLHWPILALASVCTEVLVVVAPMGDPPPLPPAEDAGVPVRVVRDPEPLGGPLVGLLAGLERAAESSVLAAAGDMPDLAEDVLAALLGALGSGDAEAVALVLRGRREPLPVALRTGAATAAARRVLGDGERRLQALLGTLRARGLEESEWRALDPLAATLRDVDVPADLEA
jgi:molybdopterin-guanine dinucleotide biosynthesis protein A